MGDDPVVRSRPISTLDALRAQGFDLSHPCRGRILVRVGLIKHKHYAFRYRVGDGHVITRRGRITGCEQWFVDGKHSHFTFLT